MIEPTCLFCKSALSVPSALVPAELCNTCAQELAARVLDACVTSWISTDGKTSVELLRALQMWEQQIALDPAVSEAAKLLVEQRDAAREENTNLRETIEGVSRSLAATVNGWAYEHEPVLGVSQALKLACDTIEDLRAGRYAPIAGRGVSRAQYDEALNAIVAGDKRLEAAIARAEKAEAREREIGEELDKATGMVEGLVAENTRFRHAVAETADLFMREAMGDKP